MWCGSAAAVATTVYPKILTHLWLLASCSLSTLKDIFICYYSHRMINTSAWIQKYLYERMMTQTTIKLLLYNTASIQNLCRASLILNCVRVVLWAHYSNATVPQLKFLYFIMAELQILKKTNKQINDIKASTHCPTLSNSSGARSDPKNV